MQADLTCVAVLKLIGPVIRLDDSIKKLFNRLHLIFHRCAPPQNAHSLTAPLLARFQKRAYPTYIVSRTFSIFEDRSVLLAYEAAVAIEVKMEEVLEYAKQPLGGPRPTAAIGEATTEETVKAWETKRKTERQKRWKQVQAVFEDALVKWRICVKEEEAKDNGVDAKAASGTVADRLTYYKKRFHPGLSRTPLLQSRADDDLRLAIDSRCAQGN